MHIPLVCLECLTVALSFVWFDCSFIGTVLFRIQRIGMWHFKFTNIGGSFHLPIMCNNSICNGSTGANWTCSVGLSSSLVFL